MFRFFKKKAPELPIEMAVAATDTASAPVPLPVHLPLPSPSTLPAPSQPAQSAQEASSAPALPVAAGLAGADATTPAASAAASALNWLRKPFGSKPAPAVTVASAPPVVQVAVAAAAASALASASAAADPPPAAASLAAHAGGTGQPAQQALASKPQAAAIAASESVTPVVVVQPAERTSWVDKLKTGLRKTGSSITTAFTGTRIDDALYEELESALLMADTGVKATQHLLDDLKRRVKDARATEPQAVKGLLADALVALLQPLEKQLVVGQHLPTVIMVAGVNGAGKTTSIGKLTQHLAHSGASVLLAAADTFRAAAREQLSVWADRNSVEIVSQEGGDPAAVSFDAVMAGRARGKDVVLIDTAGRLHTQLHLMEELKKIKRTVAKAGAAPLAGRPVVAAAAAYPHEVLLVIDGNTGQNALAQVRAFDDAVGLTGLIVTKLDGTAKGGVLAAIAQERPIPVYFIGVGEKLEDLETFNAREFAQALLG